MKIALVGDEHNAMELDDHGNLHMLREVERYDPSKYHWFSDTPYNAGHMENPRIPLPNEKQNLLTLYGLYLIGITPYERARGTGQVIIARVAHTAYRSRNYQRPLLLNLDDTVQDWQVEIEKYLGLRS